jgi:AsmA protein
LTAEDVAFASAKHRLALTGSVDFLNDTYQQLKIGLINTGNCAPVGQELNGSFTEPLIQDFASPKLKGTTAADLEKEIHSVSTGDCLFEYRGSVISPVF